MLRILDCLNYAEGAGRTELRPSLAPPPPHLNPAWSLIINVDDVYQILSIKE